jgi:L-aspartate oxidase
VTGDVTAALRALPAVRPHWHSGADIVIVGSGAAGIAAALAAAARGKRVLMITKDLTGGATPLAQGGMAAAIGPGDSAARHARDTIDAGAGLCEPETVAALAAGAPAAISRLAGLGARLERVSLRLEGGHSRHRIVHSGDDATGAEVHRVLREALLASPVEILDSTAALDLLLAEGGAVGGLLAATIGSGGELDPGVVAAGSVVLAAGGLGQAFATTTNPPGVTGDALALAARAGARLRDPEFVQFHPTVLWQDGAGQRPLITEALRGAGAVLRDLDGRPLMAGRHPLGDLAPRDVVSAVMHERIDEGVRHRGLDATALGASVLETGFPTATAACRARGIDPVTEFIPVAPGAHYSCGGIQADLDGRTSVPGLYAVGEAASTGLHGANRLASNSLTEAVIAGRRAGRAGRAGGVPGMPGVPGAPGSARPSGTPLPPPPGTGVSAASRPALAAAMSRYAGVLRDRVGLDALLRAAEEVPGAREETAGYVRAEDLDLATVEATNLHAVSVLIAAAALRREESRGCHRRRDSPWTWPDARHTVLRWDGGGLRVVADAPAGAAS